MPAICCPRFAAGSWKRTLRQHVVLCQVTINNDNEMAKQERLMAKPLSLSCPSPHFSSWVELFSNHLLKGTVFQLNLDLSGSSHQISESVVLYFMDYKEVAIISHWPKSHFPMLSPTPLVPFSSVATTTTEMLYVAFHYWSFLTRRRIW